MESIFNWLTSKLAYVVDFIMMMLPDSPFTMLSKDADIQQVLGWLNWIIPVSSMVAILEVWLTAIAIFYVYQLILRWSKAIE